MNKYITALSIAGFDSSGGAGLQADQKTFAALGCYGLSVLTSIPIQNTTGVKNCYHLPTSCIEEQLDVLIEDVNIDAIKIGMLERAEIIEAVYQKLLLLPDIKVVCDPVMKAKSGHDLLNANAITALKTRIFPLCEIITPNIPEAELLLGYPIEVGNMERVAQDLLQCGSKAVLIKGGHLSADQPAKDYLLTSQGQAKWLETPRINTKNTHGSGCTLSAAIAAYLARGQPLLEAVSNAKNYLHASMLSGADYSMGKGNGPLNHFAGMRK